MQLKEKYDVIIIGGGISGLTSAALFSRFGMSVCLLEMDARPGGYIAGFRRKDFRFDSAIHWLNQCGEKGIVTSTFKAIGMDYPKAKSQTKIRRFFIDDMDFLVTNNPDDFKDQLIENFPHEEKGIRKFFRDAKKIGRSFDNFNDVSRTMQTMNLIEKAFRGMKMLKFALPFIPHIRYHGDEGVPKGLKKYFTDEKLLSIFGAESDLLSCLIPIGWAYYGDFQTPPEGGSQTFAEWLLHVVTEYKNDVLFKSKVSQVIVENGTAKGVEFEHKGETYQVKAKNVIAACDVETLYEKMLPKGIVAPKILNNLKHAELYASAITLAIGLDCTAESLGFGEEIIYLARHDVSRFDQGSGDPHTTGIHILASSTRDKTLAPKDKGTITIFIPGFIEQFDNWKCEINEQGEYIRTEAYKKLKQEVADILLDRVEDKLSIELRKHILYLDIATPVTHLRYTGNRGGTMMGARPGKANMQAKIAHYKTPVKNLLLSGHWAELGGGVPVAIRSALNTTLLVLQQENKPAFKLLAKYVDGKIDETNIEQSSLTFPYANNWKQSQTPAQKKEE
ncbi:MAG: NAD(P)-binding protein [Crocinitomicaceae bacterium]|nr:NAD(P)-binding protein [Crocinitomicaceae bacterium]